MSYEDEHNALRTRLSDEWGSTTPVQYGNQDFTPPSGESWIRLNVINTTAEQASFGDTTNYYRHPGSVVINVFTPVLVGDKEALQLADQSANIFRNWSHNATKIRFLKPPSIKVIGEEKPWYQINVVCPFIRDTLF